MSKPDPPQYIWFNGKLCPWHEATVHVWSELATRGANVFEGIRCYKQKDGSFALLSLDRHLARLFDSVRLLRMSSSYTSDQLSIGIAELIHTLSLNQHVYIRPTIYIEYGRYGDIYKDAEYGAYIVAFSIPRNTDVTKGIRCGVSSWRRSGDLMMSPLIKAGAAYQAFRLPIIEARRQGYDEAILLNANDYVAETTGSTIFIVRRGEIITPPLSAGILESITRSHIIKLVESKLGKTVIERDITRTELYLADELFLAGTLAELTPVLSIDDQPIGNGQVGLITETLRTTYLDICEGITSDHFGWMTPLSQLSR
ncbi:branched-chain amino acid transaminase [bacterium]|nr:branched-chain amino acid transaminase [bacterium]